MRQKVSQAVDSWLSAYVGSTPGERFRAELALGFALFQIAAFSMFAIAEFLWGTRVLGLVHIAAQLPVMLCVYQLRRGHPVSRVGLLLTGNIFLIIVSVILITGGRGIGAVIALPAFILVALMLSPLRQTWIWIVLVLLAIVLAAFLNQVVSQPLVSPDPDWVARAAYRVPLLISLAFVVIAITIKRAMRRYRLQASVASELEATARATATEQAERFADFAELTGDGFWQADAEMRLTYVSPGFASTLGIDAEQALGLTPEQAYRLGAGKHVDLALMMKPIRRHEPFDGLLLRVPGVDTKDRWLTSSGRPLFDQDDEFVGYRGAVNDVSAQRETEESLRDSEQRLRTITDKLPALISYIDSQRVFQFNNRTYEQWLNRPLSEITGRKLVDVYTPKTYAVIRPFLDRAFLGEEVSFELERTARRDRHVRVTYVPDVSAGGAVAGVYGLIHDITHFKDIERKLRELSQIDGLTQLANRRCYDERLGHALALSDRSGQSLALLFLDLDDFKRLNDSLGHEAGDLALCEFARRIKLSIRESDTVARLGGDEFVIILENLESSSDAIVVAEKILEAMREPLRVQDRTWDWSTSIGIAVRQGQGADEESLLRAADKALYAAKAAGRSRYAVADGRSAEGEVND